MSKTELAPTLWAEQTSTLWQDLAAKGGGIPGGKRYVEKLKQQYQATQYAGGELIRLHDGPMYHKALEKLAAEVEAMACADRLQRLEEQRLIKEREFWLCVYEETGLDDEERLAFDPVTGAIRKRSRKEKEPPDSYKATLEGFKELVETALRNPVAAGQMAHDPCLPSWLQQMARVLSNGGLKPNLRRAIEDCVGNPALARRWHSLGAEEGMPQWFVELTAVLGARKRWEMAS